MNGEDLARLWRGEASISLRDWRVQEILHLAGQQMASQKALEQARSTARTNKQMQPVIRPGTAPDPGEYQERQISELRKRSGAADRPAANSRPLARELALEQRARRHS